MSSDSKKSSKTLAEDKQTELYQTRFKLPPNERLISDFNCALQKKILLQGHIYISKNFLCFYSKIFNSETSLAIPLSDITGVKKASVLLVPTAIRVYTTYNSYLFASFLNRDKAFELIEKCRSGEAVETLEETRRMEIEEIADGENLNVENDEENNNKVDENSDEDAAALKAAKKEKKKKKKKKHRDEEAGEGEEKEEENTIAVEKTEKSTNKKRKSDKHDDEADEKADSKVFRSAQIYESPPLKTPDPRVVELNTKIRKRPTKFDLTQPPGRRITFEGFFRRQGRWSIVDRWGILFSDYFLFTKPLNKLDRTTKEVYPNYDTSKSSYEMKQLIPLKDLTLDIRSPNYQKDWKKTKLTNCIKLIVNNSESTGNHPVYILGFQSADEKSNWSKALGLAISRYFYQNRGSDPAISISKFGWHYKFVKGTIHEAIFNEETEYLNALIAEDSKCVSEVDQECWSCLHVATRADKSSLINTLLDAGADIKVVDPNGVNCILWAAQLGFSACLASLLSHRSCSVSLWHPPKLSGKSKKSKIPRLLKTRSALWMAIAAGKNSNENLRLLFDQTDGNAKELIEDRDDDGRSLLDYCSQHNYHEAIPLLIEFGAAVDLPNSQGKTPLMQAVQKSNAAAVSALIALGAQLNLRSPDVLDSSLHCAQSLEMASFLVQHGARLGMKNLLDQKCGDQFGSRSAQNQLQTAEEAFKAKSAPESTEPMATRAASVKSNGNHSLESCYFCQEEFSIARKRDYCRRCGLIVCQPCASKRVIFRKGTKKELQKISARVCAGCYNFAYYKAGGEKIERKKKKNGGKEEIIIDDEEEVEEKKKGAAKKKKQKHDSDDEEAETRGSDDSEVEVQDEEEGIGGGIVKGFKKGFKFMGGMAGAVGKKVAARAAQFGDAMTAVAVPTNSIAENGNTIVTPQGVIQTKEKIGFADEEKGKKGKGKAKPADDDQSDNPLSDDEGEGELDSHSDDPFDEPAEEKKKPEKSVVSRVSKFFGFGDSSDSDKSGNDSDREETAKPVGKSKKNAETDGKKGGKNSSRATTEDEPRNNKSPLKENKKPNASQSPVKESAKDKKPRATADDTANSLKSAKQLASKNLDQLKAMENRADNVAEEATNFAGLAQKLKEKSRNKK